MSVWPFGRREEPAALPPPRPDRLAYVVGDIHGCDDKLGRLLARIETDRAGRPADLVLVGDYVDRGPDSAGVLRRLLRMQAAAPDRVHCLMGNHDRMLLDFLDDGPEAPRWTDIGGQETLASFGVGPQPGRGLVERRRAEAEALRAAMGAELETWLRARPLWWQSGTLVAAHALTDPTLPMDAQREAVLLWARPGRDLRPRADGAWVVHGHTIQPAPTIRAGHVAIDTGAFRGGPLTAAVFDGGAPRFLGSD
jgi:serine/threonine protein phosphatase 1